jgi:hypothetical protein
MSLLPRHPQERLRTWPRRLSVARVEQGGVWIDKPNQIGRVQIPLHLDATLVTVMHPQGERFLLLLPTLTRLGQFGGACGNGDDLAASTFSQTG